MKLISWNVNGIRAVLKKGFLDFIKEEAPDILCIQETKARPEQVTLELPGYHQFWHWADKKGYSGTAIFTTQKPLTVKKGIGIHEGEGRVLTAEFEHHYLVNVYTPNAQHGLTRLDLRQSWDVAFLHYITQLEKKKPVIFCGDLNVAHQEIDLARPKDNRGNPGFTDEERNGFSNIINAGFIDTFRHFTKEPGQYTWWSFRSNARARNIGWRIDYFCVSPQVKNKLQRATIHSDVHGSDHCPISIELDLTRL
ncbi:exodeoxyribonuclease III [Candidatus Woesearchaeota archaeon]|nr:exodeoxyribonuclease III [Candidatus Woesearchaeota archaeon]